MEYRFDFDDQLPDLPIAFDFDEVASLFERKAVQVWRIAGSGRSSEYQEIAGSEIQTFPPLRDHV